MTDKGSPLTIADRPDRRISRRTVAKGVAWAAPIIVVAPAAPALTASPDPDEPVEPTSASYACKITAGGLQYEFHLIFGNTLDVDSTVCLTGGTMYPNGCSSVGVDLTTATPETCYPVSAGLTQEFVVTSYETTCMANGWMNVQYTYTDADGKVVPTHARVEFNSVTPCG